LIKDILSSNINLRALHIFIPDCFYFLKSPHPIFSKVFRIIIAKRDPGLVLHELLCYVVFAMLLSAIATGLAPFVLRLKKPDLPRTYYTWGYPFVPFLFIGFYTWIAWQIFLSRPYTSILGLGIALSGVPFYLYKKFKLQ
jgi:APA family basic amino acid/polyamine antiporter